MAFGSFAHIGVIFRGIAQLVERRSPKPNVAGSSPVAPVAGRPRTGLDLVERD